MRPVLLSALALVLAGACTAETGAVDAPMADGAPDADGPPADGSPADAADDAVDGHQHALDGPPTDSTDAAPEVDAMPVAITSVPCSGATIAVTVFTAKSDYSPEQVTIHLGEVVRFQPLNPHDVVAGTFQAPQPWFTVPGNTIGCVRFDETGAFAFFCTAHPFSMTGTVHVTP